MGDTAQLYLFCIAANHEKCDTWAEHRIKLDKDREFIERLLLSIPDAVATGKAVQQAGREGQTALDPYPHPKLPNMIMFPRKEDRKPIEVMHDMHTEPKEVHFFSEYDTIDEVSDIGQEIVWKTDDPLVAGRVGMFWYQEDARKAAILAYKPRRVKIFWDSVPDEWNEWR